MTAVALVACSSAGADPGTPVSLGADAAPAGWKQLPAIATAVDAAARAEGIAVDAADAFGQPALGCYAVRIALRGPDGADGAAPALADQVLAGFSVGSPTAAAGPSTTAASSSTTAAGSSTTARPSKTAAGKAGGSAGAAPTLSISDVVKPSDADGVLAFAFARPPYHGRVRAQLGHGRIAAVACFANEREPLACDAPCTQVLQRVPTGSPGGAR
jgi:hypothetical protein